MMMVMAWIKAQRVPLIFGVLLAVALGFLYGAGHDRYGLFDVDEAIFTQASREMLNSGSFAMPTYNEEPRYHKPPLIYWVQGGLMALLGEDSLWAARLPSAISSLALLLMLGWWLTRMTGRWQVGMTAAAIMGINLSFMVVGRAATADGLLNLFSLAVTLSVLSQIYGEPWRRRGIDWKPILSGVLAALGLLAKGPIALVPAAIVFGMVLLARKDRAQIWKKVNPWLAGFVGIVGIIPWLILMVVQSQGGFFYEFFVVQNVQRFAGGFHNTQSQSHLYYMIVLLVGFLPWALFLPQAVVWVWKDVNARLKSHDAARALPALALFWALIYIAFFSISKTKLAHYIVPAYPALAIMLAMYFDDARVALKQRTGGAFVLLLGAFWLTVVGLVLLAVVPLAAMLREVMLAWPLNVVQGEFHFAWPPHDILTWETLRQAVPLDVAPLFAGAIVLLAALPAFVLAERRVQGGVAALAVSWACVLGLILWGVVPVVWRYTQLPLAALAETIRLVSPEVPVVHLGMHKPSVLYFSQRHFLKLERPLQLPGYLTQRRTLVLTEQESVPAIMQEIGLRPPVPRVVSRNCAGGYCLLVIEHSITPTAPAVP